jgi:hypothetical protein
MAAVPVLEREIIWVCPNCPTTARTVRADVHTQMHPCSALGGFITPMVERGAKAKIEAVVREDYVGTDTPQYAVVGEKVVPIMSVVTTRDDGQDCAAYAAVATASLD